MSDDINKPPALRPAKAPKRNPMQRANDLAFIEHHAARGKTIRQITKLLNAERGYSISPTQVFKDMRKVVAEWKRLAVTEHDAAVARELAGIQRQEDELWEAWERSKSGAKSKTQKAKGVKTDAVGGADGATTKAHEVEMSETTETSAGDVAFQNAISELRRQRRALLGLDKPTKTFATVAGPEGGNIVLEHKVKKEFNLTEYEQFCHSFFRVPKGDGAGEPVHPAHAGAEAGVVPRNAAN